MYQGKNVLFRVRSIHRGVIITGLIINEVGGFSKIISLFKPNNVVEPMNDFEMAEVGDPEVDASPQAPPEV